MAEKRKARKTKTDRHTKIITGAKVFSISLGGREQGYLQALQGKWVENRSRVVAKSLSLAYETFFPAAVVRKP